LLGTLPASADDRPIELNTDIKGQYFIVEQGGTAKTPTLLLKRTLGEESHYTKREFDCEARTVRVVSIGSSALFGVSSLLCRLAAK
jgi:hypothetical protein